MQSDSAPVTPLIVHARPTGPRSARPEDKPCAGHPRKLAQFAPPLVDGRVKLGHDRLGGMGVCAST